MQVFHCSFHAPSFAHLKQKEKEEKGQQEKEKYTNKLYALMKRVFHKTNSKQCLYELILRKKSNKLTVTFDTKVL